MEYLPPVNFTALQHRDATIVEADLNLDGAYFTGTGVAKREPGDVFRPAVGLALAMGRALQSLGEAIEAVAVDAVAVYAAEAEAAKAERIKKQLDKIFSTAVLPNFSRIVVDKDGKVTTDVAASEEEFFSDGPDGDFAGEAIKKHFRDYFAKRK